MTRITEIMIIEVPKQPVMVLHQKVPMTELGDFIPQAFSQVEEYVNSHNRVASDIPGVQICSEDGELIEIKVSVAIKDTLLGNETIISDEIPGGIKAICYYQGDNTQAESIYLEMKEYIEQLGYQEQGMREYYLNDASYGKEFLLTKMVLDLCE